MGGGEKKDGVREDSISELFSYLDGSAEKSGIEEGIKN